VAADDAEAGAGTPNATKLILAAALVLAIAVVVDVLRRAASDSVDADLAATYLALLGLLFCVRVAGQLYVRATSPTWLPPTEHWNLMPYRLLLPIQLVFVAVIAWIVIDFAAGPWLLAEPNDAFGVFLIVLSGVYAGSMAVRYAMRMARRPDQRWFGGAIPIVFHGVLAAFLFVWGAYHVSY
jgi:hypothetical protein